MGREATRPLPAAAPRAIVLAGGNGERLRGVTERWFGEPRPKQYCTFVGTRSMLQHTWDRVKTVVPAGNIVTVIAEEHERFLADAVQEPVPGRIVLQPRNRGTAPGVFLPLSHVVEDDPEAPVVIFPCDHFIYPEGRFLQYVVAAYRLCRRLPESLLLLGVAASSAETDYGWIETERTADDSPTAPLQRVIRFVEKPSAELAARLLASGGLWNTMVVAGRAGRIWELGRQRFPDLIAGFDELRQVLRAVRSGEAPATAERAAVHHLYEHLPGGDFSRDFLGAVASTTLALPLHDLLWSDWGRPKRVLEGLQQLGLQAPARVAGAF